MEYALQHLLFSFSALQKQMKDILSYFSEFIFHY